MSDESGDPPESGDGSPAATDGTDGAVDGADAGADVTEGAEDAPTGDVGIADGEAADDEAGDGEAGKAVEGEDEELAPRLSDDGIMLAFAGGACLLAATAASVTGQPRPIAVFAGVAGGTAIAAFAGDVFTDYVPDNRVHLLVGGAALVAAALALPGRDWANVATLGAAAALVLWRVVDVEYRDAER